MLPFFFLSLSFSSEPKEFQVKKDGVGSWKRIMCVDRWAWIMTGIKAFRVMRKRAREVRGQGEPATNQPCLSDLQRHNTNCSKGFRQIKSD